MKKVLKAKEKYNEVLKTTGEMRDKAEQRLQEELDKIFFLDEELTKAIQLAELSTEYMFDEDGEIVTWHRYNIPDKYREYTHFLGNYIADHGMQLDTQYDAILNYQGECIVVNDEGDVFLGHKCFLDSNGYENEEERNELIEEYMEAEGYFPTVLKSDYYGNLWHISTQKKKVVQNG